MPNISTDVLIYAVVIVIWAGSWLATQVTAHRRKAAKRASDPRLQAGPGADVRDEFTQSRRRPAERDLRDERSPRREQANATQGATKQTAAESSDAAAMQARVAASPSGANPVAPPELGTLFRDPKAFLEQMQQYAEAQQAPAASSTPAASSAPARATASPNRSGSATSRSTTSTDRPVMQRPARPVAPVRSPQPPPRPEAATAAPRPKSAAIGSAQREAQPAARRGTPVRQRLGLINHDDLRRAILLSEIIQPPVALRPNHLSDRPA